MAMTLTLSMMTPMGQDFLDDFQTEFNGVLEVVASMVSFRYILKFIVLQRLLTAQLSSVGCLVPFQPKYFSIHFKLHDDINIYRNFKVIASKVVQAYWPICKFV